MRDKLLPFLFLMSLPQWSYVGAVEEKSPIGKLKYQDKAELFDLWSLEFEPAPNFLSEDPTQIHDAYDADRNGIWLRLNAVFEFNDGSEFSVPGFAVRESPESSWKLAIRWGPRNIGKWSVSLTIKGCSGKDSKPFDVVYRLKKNVTVEQQKKFKGPLISADAENAPRYLRRLKANEDSEAIWLIGASRAWVTWKPEKADPKSDKWTDHEWLDREKELLQPMRDSGFNMLNQWMAPWEYLLVHHDRAEFWRNKKGNWDRKPIKKETRWTSHQWIDQGRAAAFDDWIHQCEGNEEKETIHLLLTPVPRQCFQTAEHPWGSKTNGFSLDETNKDAPEKIFGLSGVRKDLTVWEFFHADPKQELNDPNCILFDHQANYYRYLIARWGYSRSLGVWVLMNELEAVGNEVGSMTETMGWWKHTKCEQWLANMIRMFRGGLKRSDGLVYDGDPYQHPVHAAVTSYGGEDGKGGNLNWKGGPYNARPDLFGWHWYPWLEKKEGFIDKWNFIIDVIGSYADAPIKNSPRIISEFGTPERANPKGDPSSLYPTIFHHAVWAAVFSGHAGIPVDWDDGKEFGELIPRKRKGAFHKDRYSFQKTDHVKALCAFLKGLNPEALESTRNASAEVQLTSENNGQVLGLYAKADRSTLYGWVFTGENEFTIQIQGLAEGSYKVSWFDTWTGKDLESVDPVSVNIKKNESTTISFGRVLEKLRPKITEFPVWSRKDRGNDVAFRLTRVK